MEYTLGKLAKLAGVSARTLRYYDQIGLLPPARINSSGYRIYGRREVDRLQQILLYRAMGFELSQIDAILSSPDFRPDAALQEHLQHLRQRREQLDQLIATVEKTVLSQKGATPMTDFEKFEGFKQRLIDDNEKQYGTEIREKYGEEAVWQSYAKIKEMTPEQHAELEALSQELNETLRRAAATGDPAGGEAQRACALHKRWLCFYWSHYSKEAHKGIAQMYVDDPRFTAYYEKIAPGCAVFLRDAIMIYCA